MTRFGETWAMILYVAIQRLGSGQFGWLAVLRILLLGTVLGTIRTCAGGSGIGFEAQDTVKLLWPALRDESIGERTRIRENDGIMVVKEEGQCIADEFACTRYEPDPSLDKMNWLLYICSL